jgi:threonine/homoserine/homoserine lactone efflux protein
VLFVLSNISQRADSSARESHGADIFHPLLPQFIDARHATARQVAILALTSVSIEFCVLAGYGAIAGRMTRLAAQPRFAKLTNRIAGTMLIAAGAGIASLKRA